MKELLEQMFKGWRLHVDSWDEATGKFTRSDTECMIEACDGDQLKGELLSLFSHWSNDILSLAAHYGVGYNGPVEPAPDESHWYDISENVWRPIEQEVELND